MKIMNFKRKVRKDYDYFAIEIKNIADSLIMRSSLASKVPVFGKRARRIYKPARKPVINNQIF